VGDVLHWVSCQRGHLVDVAQDTLLVRLALGDKGSWVSPLTLHRDGLISILVDLDGPLSHRVVIGL
jgi:hypothetical protein